MIPVNVSSLLVYSSWYISVYIVACLLAWMSLAQLDFLFPFLYEYLNIEDYINRTAVLNSHRPGFELTDKETRLLMFSGIVDGIHNNGLGLDRLFYEHKFYGKIPVLTKPEIAHLKDVASVVNYFFIFAFTAFIILIASTIYLVRAKTKFPPISKSVFVLIVIHFIVLVLVYLLDPNNVFDQLHVWLFPADTYAFESKHSLMVTLMKAPEIFAWISAEFAIVNIGWFILILMSYKTFVQTRYTQKIKNST